MDFLLFILQQTRSRAIKKSKMTPDHFW